MIKLIKELISYWYKSTFGGKIKKMAVKITTIAKILEELNKSETGNPWQELPGVLSIPQVNIFPSTGIINNGNIIVAKFFINSKTGEIKSYVAKVTDAPETESLP